VTLGSRETAARIRAFFGVSKKELLEKLDLSAKQLVCFIKIINLINFTN
jgi:hypothetical protein